MDTIRTTAAGGEFPLADGPALNEVLSEALDRGGIGLILLQRGQSTISFMNHAARRLFGFSSAQADIQVSDLLTRLAGVDQISVQAGDHPIMRALAGQSGTACGCRIDNGGALTRFVQARYGTVDAATAFVLLEGASPGLDEAADGASTEQRLRAQIKRFYIPTFVWQFLDGDFILREFNDAASAATRGDVDSSVGVAAAQIYQDRPDIREDIQRCFQEKTTISKEIAYQTRSGREPRDWAITYTYVPPDLVMVHAEDITNRKRAEQLLRDREERLRMLVEQVPAILWSTDTQLCVTSTAGSALAALNATPEQAVGRTLSKLFATLPDGEQVISAHQNALRGVSTGYEITFKGRVFQSHVEPLQAQDGSIIGTIGLGRDVTDGKRAERALGQSEERYRAFVAQSSEGIWRLEVEPPIPTSLPADEQAGLMMDRCFVRECNDVMAKMYGLSAASDLVGKSWRALHVEGDSLNLDGLRRFIASGYRTSDSESHDVNASGDIKYFANNAAGIVEHGKLVRIWGTQQDITQRKAGEAERAALLAREKTARLEAETAWLEWRQMFDAMTESVSLLDIEGRIRRANKAFYMKWGKNPSECIGKPLHQIAHKNQDEADACPICQLRGRGVRAAIEIPPGVIGQRPLYVALDPILDSNGVKTGFVQQVKDLSELYLARAQAERERTSLNATIEQMAEGLLVCDEHGSVIRANRLAQEILGIPLAEMMADTTAELPRGRFANLEGRVLEVDQLPVQRALAEKQVFDASRLWYTRPDGARILLSIVASPFLNEQGGLAGAVTLIRDVTEQQREHEHVHQADKMRALGELSSGVAHNFNNALASILGYTQLAQRTTNGTDLAKYLGIIQKSAQDAARMVERIQNFSRSHPRTGDFRPVRLMDIAIDAVEIARPRWQSDAESLGISYDVSFDWRAAEDVSVDGEPSELREVFLNIILNALDAMPSGGSLAISAVQEIEALIVSFTDTGAGMSPEIKQRVFEPFFTTKSSTGLGLGLSESYRIIERHGGRIDIDTRLHAGTTFSVMLPTRVSSGLPAQEPEREMSVRPLNILVLDDEDLVRGALAAMLAAMGHLVVEASTAQEAVAHVDAQVFDLVFTDLAMPVVDGIAAAELLKAARPNLKLILMSGYGSDKAAERAEESKSIDGVISKPFTFSEIQQIVVEVLRS